LAFFRKHT